MNLAKALGFFSTMCTLKCVPESDYHLVTTLSVESWPGVLQLVQKHIRGWKVNLEASVVTKDAVPRKRVEDLSDIWVKELLSFKRENTSDFVQNGDREGDKQQASGRRA